VGVDFSFTSRLVLLRLILREFWIGVIVLTWGTGDLLDNVANLEAGSLLRGVGPFSGFCGVAVFHVFILRRRRK
jgi:hypothetical protein